MKLNALKVSGKHPTWCGPSAMSIISGRTVNHCAKLIAGNRNRRPAWENSWYKGRGSSKQVKGCGNGEVKRGLLQMGFVMERVREPGMYRETLRSYMAGRGGPNWKGVMLVNVTDHYVVINRDTVSDNHQQDKHYTEHRWKLKRIENAWIIRRKRVT